LRDDRGLITFEATLGQMGRIDTKTVVTHPPRLTRQFHSWFRTSPFADFIPAEPVAAGR
jgi:hypothetical protein